MSKVVAAKDIAKNISNVCRGEFIRPERLKLPQQGFREVIFDQSLMLRKMVFKITAHSIRFAVLFRYQIAFFPVQQGMLCPKKEALFRI